MTVTTCMPRAGKHAVHLIVSRTATGSSVRFVAAFAAMHMLWARRCEEVSRCEAHSVNLLRTRPAGLVPVEQERRSQSV